MSKELPTLTGHRFRQRKRDEKVKYDAGAFIETIVTHLNEVGENFEEIAKYLDQAGSTLDYKRYAESLLDILIAGGQLVPGGRVETNPPSETCVFSADPSSLESVQRHVQLLQRLFRRYRHLPKVMMDEMKKVLNYVKDFRSKERSCLAIYTGLCLAEGLVTAHILAVLLGEHLVKDSISIEFCTKVFAVWLKEKGIGHVGSGLRRAHLEGKLMDFFPVSRRKRDIFDAHFREAGLDDLIKFHQAQQNMALKRRIKSRIDEMLADGSPLGDITEFCQQCLETDPVSDVDITIILWHSIMSAVEWNKKEDLLAKQAMEHLQANSELFIPFCKQGTPQLTLLLKMQEFCYDNMNFTKVFHKIVLLLYKNDVLTEQAVLKWYHDAHLAKGKSVFLPQMRRMVEWLNTADEESDKEEEENP